MAARQIDIPHLRLPGSRFRWLIRLGCRGRVGPGRRSGRQRGGCGLQRGGGARPPGCCRVMHRWAHSCCPPRIRSCCALGSGVNLPPGSCGARDSRHGTFECGDGIRRDGHRVHGVLQMDARGGYWCSNNGPRTGLSRADPEQIVDGCSIGWPGSSGPCRGSRLCRSNSWDNPFEVLRGGSRRARWGGMATRSSGGGGVRCSRPGGAGQVPVCSRAAFHAVRASGPERRSEATGLVRCSCSTR